MLRFYIEVARTAFRRQLIYRWANLAGLLTNTFFGAVFSYVIIALYSAARRRWLQCQRYAELYLAGPGHDYGRAAV